MSRRHGSTVPARARPHTEAEPASRAMAAALADFFRKLRGLMEGTKPVIDSGPRVYRSVASSAPSTAGRWRELEPDPAEGDAIPHTARAEVAAAGFRLVAASRRGRSHAHSGRWREDAFSIAVAPPGASKRWWLAAVADGAGSCPLARVGAQAAVGAATRQAGGAVSAGVDPATAIAAAAGEALRAILREAERRRVPAAWLSSTLLLLLWVAEGDGGEAYALQVGDGLIGVVRGDNPGPRLSGLALPDQSGAANLAMFLTAAGVEATLGGRVARARFEQRPTLLVCTDGVSDDFFPASNQQALLGALEHSARAADAGAELLETLSYRRRGSNDDRTVVYAWGDER